MDPKAVQRATGEALSRIYSLELTGILPIGNNFGFLGQFAVPDHGNRLFRVGLIYTPKKAESNGNSATTNGQTNSGTTTVTTQTMQVSVEGLVLSSTREKLDGANVEVQVFPDGTLNDQTCSGNAAWTPVKTDITEKGLFLVDGSVASARSVCVQVTVKNGEHSKSEGYTIPVPAPENGVSRIELPRVIQMD
jgi:hypothetical protein